ncbi:MAG TPA: DUF4157 domain-containing protein [Pseudonocardia sp.]|uniref:eCIS core domain-containing protein n=1 Tax=Pseudonocardia sp. TaxID=60912 RepID=UPI002F425140
MSPPDQPTPERPTLGQRLDRQARDALARRGELARHLADRMGPARRWDAPAARRLRVEADIPAVWDEDEPGGMFDFASAMASYSPLAPSPVDSTAATPLTSLPVPFPVQLRERLRPIVGPGLDRVVLHDGEADPAADALARAHHAAAVTVGQQIFLRRGRFRQDSPRGRGLLAHEAVHAARATRPGTGWQRATAGGRAAEEQAAHAVGAAVTSDSTVTGNDVAPAATPPRPGAEPAPAGHVLQPEGGGQARTQRLVTGQRVSFRADGGSSTPARADAVGYLPRADGSWPRVSNAGRPGGRAAVSPGPAQDPGSAALVTASHRGVATTPSRLPSAVPGPALRNATASTSAGATPMAAPADGSDPALAPPAPAAPPGAGPDAGRDAMLRELIRQMRTDRERGA